MARYKLYNNNNNNFNETFPVEDDTDT